MSAATRGKRTNPIRVRNLARLILRHEQILARHRSPGDMGRTRASPAIDAMTINQCHWPTLQHVPCPAANASTSDFHEICLTESTPRIHTNEHEFKYAGKHGLLACGFESLAVVSHPLQRLPAERDFHRTQPRILKLGRFPSPRRSSSRLYLPIRNPCHPWLQFPSEIRVNSCPFVVIEEFSWRPEETSQGEPNR
jgi:hypothetical protein